MKNANGKCSGTEASVNTAPRLITGMWLAHAQLSKAERAYVAADLYFGDAKLVEPTMQENLQDELELVEDEILELHYAQFRLKELQERRAE
jgi:hypothetical protein